MDSHAFFLLILALGVGSVCRYWRVNPAPCQSLLGLRSIGSYKRYSRATRSRVHPDAGAGTAVFAAALASSAVDLRRFRRSVLLLAVVLVTITTVVVGVVASATSAALTLASACALGVILAPTDAVAAAVAAKTGLPSRVQLVIEGRVWPMTAPR